MRNIELKKEQSKNGDHLISNFYKKLSQKEDNFKNKSIVELKILKNVELKQNMKLKLYI